MDDLLLQEAALNSSSISSNHKLHQGYSVQNIDPKLLICAKGLGIPRLQPYEHTPNKAPEGHKFWHPYGLKPTFINL